MERSGQSHRLAMNKFSPAETRYVTVESTWPYIGWMRFFIIICLVKNFGELLTMHCYSGLVGDNAYIMMWTLTLQPFKFTIRCIKQEETTLLLTSILYASVTTKKGFKPRQARVKELNSGNKTGTPVETPWGNLKGAIYSSRTEWWVNPAGRIPNS